MIIGHYDCGAVRAANKRQDLGLLENWLRLIRDVYRLHKDYIDLISVRITYEYKLLSYYLYNLSLLFFFVLVGR